jgi:hypothetical protein
MDIVSTVLAGTLEQLIAERDKLDKAIEYLEKLTAKVTTKKEKASTDSITVEQKCCERCDTVKHSADFFRDKRTSDGLSRMCKDCRGNKSV